MRLKPSLKNTVKPVLLLSLVPFLIIPLSGCSGQIEPTYKEENIPSAVKQICKDEYNLDVIAKRTATTLWIYAPLSRILRKEYGIKENEIFDEETMEKLRKILSTIGRVLINSDNTPEFFVLLASDINSGLDYVIFGYVLDIKKSYANFIPWTEANRRYVIKFGANPQAIGDKTGSHFQVYDIELPYFLAEQIAQRIAARLQEEDLKKDFTVERLIGRFSNNAFIFEYSIEQTSLTDKKIRALKEMLNIITYCVKTYEFKDFSLVEIKDLVTQDRLVLDKAEIWARSINERF